MPCEGLKTTPRSCLHYQSPMPSLVQHFTSMQYAIHLHVCEAVVGGGGGAGNLGFLCGEIRGYWALMNVVVAQSLYSHLMPCYASYHNIMGLQNGFVV